MKEHDKKLKHRLPPFSMVDHLNLSNNNLEELKVCVDKLKNRFSSVVEANRELCGIQHSLATKVYENFNQISLTDSDSLHSSHLDLNSCYESNQTLFDGLSFSERIRQKKALANLPNSPFNETTYKIKTSVYLEFKSLFDKILSPFKSLPTRTRLVCLKAGTSVPPHIDYDPAYSVRIIIPIISNMECINFFWAKNNTYSTSFLPGKAYFLNTGYKHAVVNFSKEDRYTFLVSVDGINDIKHLLS